MAEEIGSKRVYWTKQQGAPLLVLDLSQATPEESLALIDRFATAIEGQGPGSVRLLANLTGTHYEPAIVQKWRAVGRQYDALLKATAGYGANGLVGLAVRSFVEMMALFSPSQAHKKLRLFKTREQALAWLSQK